MNKRCAIHTLKYPYTYSTLKTALLYAIRSCGRVVGAPMVKTIRGRGSELRHREEISPFQITQTGPGAHSVSNSMRTASYSPGVNQPGCESGYPSHIMPTLRICGVTPPFPYMPSILQFIHVGGNKI